ncbi:aquaporin-like protein [Periconia macrospinosa]|uniref:Aquaporin-like protein n=1 Tax=Periconia macrospinosa TaxID=97972 RepID=A0A2V1E7T5_9PLEO|nr:aquaporin-like protein [Periconia macrospinosa]
MNVNEPSNSFMVLPGMKPAYTTDPSHPGEKRLPELRWLPNRVRHVLISMLGEFVGTYLFLFFAFAATQVANTPPSELDKPASTTTLLYISLAFGFSLAVNVWVFFRISGGLFNPAVSVALALVGAIGWLKAGLLIISQVLGGIAAAAVTSALLPGDLNVRTSLSEGTSITRGLFIEMLLTAELIFCIFMLAAEKHKATFLAPIGIGLALFIAELAGVYFTGGSLNPARSFGPDVILRTFDGYHWIYWVGPLLGAVVAVLFYRLIKVLEYETANPGADSDGGEPRHTGSSAEEEGRHAGHRTDGTDESEFVPPFHPINKPAQSLRSFSSRQETGFTTKATAVNESYPLQLLPSQPSSILHHGGDGYHSFEHSDDRSAQPRQSAASVRSRSRSHVEEASDHSFRSAPNTESGSSEYSSRSS